MEPMRTDMVIAAPWCLARETLADLEGVSQWNPTVDAAECVSDQRQGLGARGSGRCYMHPTATSVRLGTTAWTVFGDTSRPRPARTSSTPLNPSGRASPPVVLGRPRQRFSVGLVETEQGSGGVASFDEYGVSELVGSIVPLGRGSVGIKQHGIIRERTEQLKVAFTRLVHSAEDRVDDA